MGFYLGLILALIGLDQLFKYWARLYLRDGAMIELIPNLIHLTHSENQGISFSLFSELPALIRVPFLAGISLLVVVVLCIYVYRQWHALRLGEKWGFSLIIAGAVGNLIDRVFRQSVTDYMYFHWYETGFFVNNFADDLISIGFVLLLYQVFRKRPMDRE